MMNLMYMMKSESNVDSRVCDETIKAESNVVFRWQEGGGETAGHGFCDARVRCAYQLQKNRELDARGTWGKKRKPGIGCEGACWAMLGCPVYMM